jgi:hypothetical protein
MRRAIEESLHGQVEKWLAPELAATVRVKAFGRSRFNGARYVRIEAQSQAGPRALYFFRHNDGSWRVYPPSPDSNQPSATHAAKHNEAAVLPPTASRRFRITTDSERARPVNS